MLCLGLDGRGLVLGRDRDGGVLRVVHPWYDTGGSDLIFQVDVEVPRVRTGMRRLLMYGWWIILEVEEGIIVGFYSRASFVRVDVVRDQHVGVQMCCSENRDETLEV